MITNGGIIKAENLEKELIRFYDFNNDLNGNNGKEYTMPEALDLNLTTIEYFIHLANVKQLSSEETIRFVCEKAVETYSGYRPADYKVIKIDNGTYVIFFVSRNV